jgi:O-antigen ligase
MGIMYLIFSDKITFESLIGKILPASFKSTTAGRIISVRSLGKDLYFFGIAKRLSSIASTSIHYGAFCLLIFPFGFYYFSKSHGFSRLLYLGFIILTFLMAFFAQARTALVLMSLIIFAYTLIALNNKVKLFHPYAYFTLVFSYIFLFLFAFIFMFYKEIIYISEVFFIINRASSFEHRQEIYERTIHEILRNPILGYGTQRSVEDMFYPIGSHSWYLSILYKHGVFGLLSFVFFYLGLLWLMIKRLVFAIHSSRHRIMICYTFIVLFLSHALLVLTIEPIVDAMHIFILAIIAGLALSIGRLLLE